MCDIGVLPYGRSAGTLYYVISVFYRKVVPLGLMVLFDIGVLPYGRPDGTDGS